MLQKEKTAAFPLLLRLNGTDEYCKYFSLNLVLSLHKETEGLSAWCFVFSSSSIWWCIKIELLHSLMLCSSSLCLYSGFVFLKLQHIVCQFLKAFPQKRKRTKTVMKGDDYYNTRAVKKLGFNIPSSRGRRGKNHHAKKPNVLFQFNMFKTQMLLL